MRRGLIFFTILGLLLGSFLQCGGGKTTKKPEKPVVKTTTPAPVSKKVAPKPTAKPAEVPSRPSPKSTTPAPAKSQPQEQPQPVRPSKPEPQPDTTQQKIQPIPQPPKVEVALPQDTIRSLPIQPAPAETLGIMTQPDTSEVQVMESSEEIAEEPPLPPPPPEPPFISRSELYFDDIYFDENQSAQPSSSFNPNYFVSLSKVLRMLKNEPLCHIRLKGHIGINEKGKVASDLDFKRAICIGRLLLELIPDSQREAIAKRLEPVAVGTEEPLVATHHKTAAALNRRVSFELVCDAIPERTMADYLKTLERAPKPISTSKASPPSPSTKPASRPSSAITALYDNGLRLYEKKQLAAAINTFQEVVELNPSHSLADNAQWWIGEVLYQQGQYQRALAAYQQVFNLGDRNKAAYAQLRIGYCLWRLEQKAAALEAFQQVIERYPQATEEVTKARKMVQILRQG